MARQPRVAPGGWVYHVMNRAAGRLRMLRTVGYGHLYGGRFKSFPVQPGRPLVQVCRYVERNALTAGLVRRAEQWRWGSLWVRRAGTAEQRNLLSAWPTPRPGDWLERVNEPLTAKEQTRWEQSLRRGRPFGEDAWVMQSARNLRLDHTLRGEGRPRQDGPKAGRNE